MRNSENFLMSGLPGHERGGAGQVKKCPFLERKNAPSGSEQISQEVEPSACQEAGEGARWTEGARLA